MNLQQLTYFHKIAERKNYTKASQELSVSQSNLSHSMSKLEGIGRSPVREKGEKH